MGASNPITKVTVHELDSSPDLLKLHLFADRDHKHHITREAGLDLLKQLIKIYRKTSRQVA